MVRMISIDGKAYVEVSDVAKALGYLDVSRAVRDHCRGGVTYPVINSLGRTHADLWRSHAIGNGIHWWEGIEAC